MLNKKYMPFLLLALLFSFGAVNYKNGSAITQTTDFVGTASTKSHVIGVSISGEELHTDANAASDPNGNEANATTGWTDGASTGDLTSESDPYAGTYALQYSAGDTNSERMELLLTVENGETYRVTFWAKRGSQGTDQQVASWDGIASGGPSSVSIASTSYAEFSYDVVTNDTTLTIRVYACVSGASGDKVVVDNLTCRKIS